MPAAGEAVGPKERARFVDESASVARGHGEVWKRGLQVESPDAPHIAGTYTFAPPAYLECGGDPRSISASLSISGASAPSRLSR